jgi:hypothetical protein
MATTTVTGRSPLAANRRIAPAGTTTASPTLAMSATARSDVESIQQASSPDCTTWT